MNMANLENLSVSLIMGFRESSKETGRRDRRALIRVTSSFSSNYSHYPDYRSYNGLEGETSSSGVVDLRFIKKYHPRSESVRNRKRIMGVSPYKSGIQLGVQNHNGYSLLKVSGFIFLFLISLFWLSMEEVQNRLQKVELSEAESIQVITRRMDIKHSVYFLVGKVLTRKFDLGAVKRATKNVWRLDNPYKIEQIKEYKMLFTFKSSKDRDKVFEGGPWHCENRLMVLSKTTGLEDPATVPLHIQDFWIQFHGFPPLLLTKNMGVNIGEYLGSVSSVDVSADGFSPYPFLRVRVAIDTSKPLKRVADVKMAELNKVFQVDIFYEKLPKLCALCGRLNHVMDECHLLENSDSSKELVYEYGEWLCAPELKKKIVPNRAWIVTDEFKQEIKLKRKFEDTSILFDESDCTDWVERSDSSKEKGSSSNKSQWNPAVQKKKKQFVSESHQFSGYARRGRGRGSSSGVASSFREGSRQKNEGLNMLQKPQQPPYSAVVAGTLVPIPQTAIVRSQSQLSEKGKEHLHSSTDMPSFAAMVAGKPSVVTKAKQKLFSESEEGGISNSLMASAIKVVPITEIAVRSESGASPVVIKPGQKVKEVQLINEASVLPTVEGKKTGSSGNKRDVLSPSISTTKLSPSGKIIFKALLEARSSPVPTSKRSTPTAQKNVVLDAVKVVKEKEESASRLEALSRLAVQSAHLSSTKDANVPVPVKSCKPDLGVSIVPENVNVSSSNLVLLESVKEQRGNREVIKDDIMTEISDQSSSTESHSKIVHKRESPKHSAKKIKKSVSTDSASVSNVVDVEMAMEPSQKT